jgi:plastocyanin
MGRVIAILWVVLFPLHAVAGDVQVNVRTSAGKPVPDAVVSMSAPHAGAVRFPWAYRMAQQNKMFDPFVLIVPVGADVAFPNLDRVLHEVYSFSPAKTFELRLYGHDETRVVHFDKPGIVALGCNIHDSMVAFIDVVETPFAAKTDAAGEAVIHGVPAGPQTLRVWHPYLKSAGNERTAALIVPREGTVRAQVTGDLRAPPEHMRMY